MLLFETGKVDHILRGIIQLCEMALPNRIRAYYLTGSYSDHSAVASSDIDLEVVLMGKATDEERAKIETIGKASSLLSPILMDLTPVSEHEIATLEGEGPYSAISILAGGVLLYGEDTRAQMRLPPLDEFVANTMFSVPHIFARTRASQLPLHFPLNYPDPKGEFFGYDSRIMRDATGKEQHGTKDMVVGVCWAASAILAMKVGRYVCKKHQTIELYREVIADEWGDFMHAIDAKCRVEWEYLVPTNAEARAELREICRQMLGFENHFLQLYQVYALEQLKNPVWQIAAQEGLAAVSFEK